MTTKTPPNPQNVRDMRLMLAGARLLIKQILEPLDKDHKLKDYKFMHLLIECAYKDRESLVSLLFFDDNIVKWQDKKIIKIKPYRQDNYEEQIKRIMPEWEALVKGE